MRSKIIVLISLGLLLITAGCQNTAQKPLTPTPTPNQNRINNVSDMTTVDGRAMANRMANLAEQVNGVRSATVIVSSPGTTTNNMTGNNINNPNLTNPGNITDNRVTRTPSTGLNTTPNNRTGITNNNLNRTNAVIVMVGLTLNQNVMNDSQAINNVKRSVANKLKASDQRVSQVLVTSDPNLVRRIDNVASGIIQGRPIANFQNDITDLTRKMTSQQLSF